MLVCACVCVRAFVCLCVRVCVRAYQYCALCARACVGKQMRACVQVHTEWMQWCAHWLQAGDDARGYDLRALAVLEELPHVVAARPRRCRGITSRVWSPPAVASQSCLV